MASTCPHYVRKCSFVTPCCNKVYSCRFCHNAAERTHELDRKTVQQIKCNQCGKLQGIVSHCSECGIKFGFYFCPICRLYDDRDKGQFHCDYCGVCRIGGRENYFHCTRCDMCFPKNIRSSHTCVEKSSRSNCPICMEDLHSSPVPCQVLRCGHLLHRTCFQECLKSRLQHCPLCSTLMI
ncbi:RING finger and CHY zinc finger domain-containing protein 1-like [Montipora foliosa]|uniref:RING finger and CHY zinc finger domain-containing protein 1-like n=1 Tax=Montipora foliosa TaxID=591990 RepID=UPI0035F149C3